MLLSEENHESLRALKGRCLHWHLKKAYIDNHFREKSRESRGLRARLCSLTHEESLY
jgi:hypothetical protein